jgi:hypothetical protein
MELETRKCLCGCGESFRCLPTSKNRYFSRAHEKSPINDFNNLNNHSRNKKEGGRSVREKFTRDPSDFTDRPGPMPSEFGKQNEDPSDKE